MASTRLRKTFQYPDDHSDDDETPEVMDEEEQEKLIAKLRKDDEERNEQYKRIFLAIPIIAATSYLPALMMSRLISAKVISLFSMTSLLTTAYILVFVPNPKATKAKSEQPWLVLQRHSRFAHEWISYLNEGLSLLIALNAFTFRSKRGVHEGFWLLCFLPAVSLCTIMLARSLMLSVDVDELEKLKYGYKGA